MGLRLDVKTDSTANTVALRARRGVAGTATNFYANIKVYGVQDTFNPFSTSSATGTGATVAATLATVTNATRTQTLLVDYGGGVTDSKGSGVPSGACITGSTYRRTDGAAGATLYVCEAAAWVAK